MSSHRKTEETKWKCTLPLISYGLGCFSYMRTIAIIPSEKNAFSAVWMGYANQPIIARQDILRITVEDEDNQYVIGELEHLVSDREFDQAYVYLELSLKDIMPLRTVLAQNYPNPFNPKT